MLLYFNNEFLIFDQLYVFNNLKVIKCKLIIQLLYNYISNILLNKFTYIIIANKNLKIISIYILERTKRTIYILLSI